VVYRVLLETWTLCTAQPSALRDAPISLRTWSKKPREKP